ncbi:MAG: helix-hairpin-helix domain-containing protein [Rothia sp. (in: high G+C Gram-positive bacteria)]|nr:helix-hairpin-helix domain-containing protein [Rothia sp. (in: high G+C Gram-positive bacteria)]
MPTDEDYELAAPSGESSKTLRRRRREQIASEDSYEDFTADYPSRPAHLLDEFESVEDNEESFAHPPRRSRWNISSQALLGLCAIIVVIAVAVFLLNPAKLSSQSVPLEQSGEAEQQSIRQGATEEKNVPSTRSLTTSAGDTATSETQVWVHVAGAVKKPGMYRISSSLRVGNAIDLAGGATAQADLNQINLAEKVNDGSQIRVPQQGETAQAMPPSAASAGVPASSASAHPTSSAGGIINLNTATAEELESLPRVGPKLAQKIIEYRETHGSFTSVDQLNEVSGIGDTMLANIAPQATV